MPAIGMTNGPIAEPLFILGAPRSFTSVVCAMLGQHPEMYSLPELHLFVFEHFSDWWALRESDPRSPITHGLLRAVAQICFGCQTDPMISNAADWLQQRTHFSAAMMFQTLAALIYPAVPVDKSPSAVCNTAALHRMHSAFPQARYLHLVRHPRGYSDSVIRAIRNSMNYGEVPEWLASLVQPQGDGGADLAASAHQSWYRLNRNICEVLNDVPGRSQLRVRAEDLIEDPDRELPKITDWLGLPSDANAIQAMQHPECSPFACLGPPSAPLGNDVFFLRSPYLHRSRAKRESLNGKLTSRNGDPFSEEVFSLATTFGYS